MKKLFLIIVFTLIAQVSGATVYYVDNQHGSTSDSNPGTSESAPWETIDHATSTMVAGDTTYVKDGTYYEVVEFDNSGSSEENRITLMAYPGDTPLIDGSGSDAPDWMGSIYGEYQDYITVDGFEIQDSDEYGICFTYGEHITIKNCIVHDVNTNRNGITFIYTNNSLIERNEVYATGWNCIGVYSSSNVTVRYNYVHDNPNHVGVNIFPKTNEDPQLHYAGNHIIGNIADGVWGGIYIRFQYNAEIVGNVIFDDLVNAICIDDNHSGETHDYEATGLVIHNNTVANAASCGYKNYNATDVVLKNNIFYSNGAGTYAQVEIRPDAVEDSILDYNIYYGYEKIIYNGTTYSTLSSFQSATSQETNGFVDNPDFTAIGSDDFTLTSDSPARDAGENLGSSYDDAMDPGITVTDTSTYALLDQDNYGDEWEIGAFVYGAAGSTINYTTESGTSLRTSTGATFIVNNPI